MLGRTAEPTGDALAVLVHAADAVQVLLTDSKGMRYHIYMALSTREHCRADCA